MEPRYIYNITLHCDAASAKDVLYYIQKVMYPTWAGYPYWQDAKLLRLHQVGRDVHEGDASYAMQFTTNDLQELQAFHPEEDPCIQRIEQAYGNRVLFTDTILEVLA